MCLFLFNISALIVTIILNNKKIGVKKIKYLPIKIKTKID